MILSSILGVFLIQEKAKVKYGRQPQHFFKTEDNLDYLIIEDNLNFFRFSKKMKREVKNQIKWNLKH